MASDGLSPIISLEMAADVVPRIRTNAQSCRDEVAKLVTHPNNNMMIKIDVITEAPAWD